MLPKGAVKREEEKGGEGEKEKKKEGEKGGGRGPDHIFFIFTFLRGRKREG